MLQSQTPKPFTSLFWFPYPANELSVVIMSSMCSLEIIVSHPRASLTPWNHRVLEQEPQPSQVIWTSDLILQIRELRPKEVKCPSQAIRPVVRKIEKPGLHTQRILPSSSSQSLCRPPGHLKLLLRHLLYLPGSLPTQVVWLQLSLHG